VCSPLAAAAGRWASMMTAGTNARVVLKRVRVVTHADGTCARAFMAMQVFVSPFVESMNVVIRVGHQQQRNDLLHH